MLTLKTYPTFLRILVRYSSLMVFFTITYSLLAMAFIPIFSPDSLNTWVAGALVIFSMTSMLSLLALTSRPLVVLPYKLFNRVNPISLVDTAERHKDTIMAFLHHAFPHAKTLYFYVTVKRKALLHGTEVNTSLYIDSSLATPPKGFEALLAQTLDGGLLGLDHFATGEVCTIYVDLNRTSAHDRIALASGKDGPAIVDWE